jgi:kojibiose phosphorylase
MPLSLPATPTTDPAWLLVEEGFQLAREHEVESLFTVANGYVGTRGSLAEGSALSRPATVVAGLFARASHPGALPELAVLPDWTRMRGSIGGEALRLDAGQMLEHRRMLDLRQGILWREWRQKDGAGRISLLRGFRFASLADRHLLVQSVTLTAENYDAPLVVESALAPPAPPAPEAPAPLLIAEASDVVPQDPRIGALALCAEGTGLGVGLALGGELSAPQPAAVRREVEAAPDRYLERWELEIHQGEICRVDRLVAIHTSRDDAQPAGAAVRQIERALAEGVGHAVEEHVRAWAARWEAADVEVEGDANAQRALRFAIYHLISACNPEDEHVSIGARALTGRDYLGHVFWDTELFMLPFFLLTHPPSARALLMYRYHTLPAAREKARALGYRGALYAWESAMTGEDVTPTFALAPGGEVEEIRNGEQENHVSGAVAYAVCQYWQATRDEAFLLDAGAEIVLETARFWASRGEVEEDGRYHIRHVIGPDEYHDNVDDNAYTNLLAQWNLEAGVEVARLLQARWPERWRVLSERLGVGEGEMEEWTRLAGLMYTGFDPRSGLYEQFAGYFEKESIDLTEYEPRTTAMDVLLGRDRTRGSNVIRQADVVMALFLFWDRIPPEVREANFRYYAPRTAHDSSLSPAIHALVAARLGDGALAAKFFRQASEIDLANNMGNAAGGVHAASIGALWQAAVFGYGGLELGEEALAIEPHLAPGWTRLDFPFEWRGQRLRIELRADSVCVQHAEGEAAVPVTLGGQRADVAPGQMLRAVRGDEGWGPWQEVSS